MLKNIGSWDTGKVMDFDAMFDNAISLSNENKCAIHLGFSQNSVWADPDNWLGFCPGEGT